MAVNRFLKSERLEDMHEILCFLRCYEYCVEAGITDIFDVNEMLGCLRRKIKSSIREHKENWKNSYMCKPSQFMITHDSVFYMDNKELSDYEAEFIMETMNSDGTWNVTWDWEDYPEQWAISKNWYENFGNIYKYIIRLLKSVIIIDV